MFYKQEANHTKGAREEESLIIKGRDYLEQKDGARRAVPGCSFDGRPNAVGQKLHLCKR
jgi:hypothetical protein